MGELILGVISAILQAVRGETAVTTDGSGQATISFPTPFASTPKSITAVVNGTDFVVRIVSKTASSFVVKILQMAAIPAHTHSVPGLSIPGLSIPALSIAAPTTTNVATDTHTHSIPGLSVPALSIAAPTTASNVPQSSTAISSPTLSTILSSSTLFAATVSGGSPTQSFVAVGLTTSSTVPANTGSWSGITVVTGIPSTTGTGTTGTGTSGTPSATVAVVTAIPSQTGTGTTGTGTTGTGTTGSGGSVGAQAFAAVPTTAVTVDWIAIP